MAVTKDIAATKIQAETADYIERLRIQREEGQYAQHKATQTANIGAFQVEKQAKLALPELLHSVRWVQTEPVM